jgi:hypothetical protein
MSEEDPSRKVACKKRKNKDSFREPYSLSTNKIQKLAEQDLHAEEEINGQMPYDLESMASDPVQPSFRRYIAASLLAMDPTLRRAHIADVPTRSQEDIQPMVPPVVKKIQVATFLAWRKILHND